MKKYIFIFIEVFIFFLVLGSLLTASYAAKSNGNTTFDTTNSVVNPGGISPSPILAPVNPEFIAYQKSKSLSTILSGHETDFVPPPVNISHLSRISINRFATTPASYDLRTLNRITAVKNQGSGCACWDFATFGSLESVLMPGEYWDFSENNMKNLLSSAYPEGFDRDANRDGANYWQSTAYLARWSGPVNESDDPYNDTSTSSPTGLHVQKHVQDVLFIPDRNGSLDNDEIKWAIQNYGALYTTLYLDYAYNISSPYYSPNNYSYYYDGTTVPAGSLHAVDIIGWDDSYDKNKFSKIPPGNGAFIVKNSWGTNWFDKGYFYVSYYDLDIGKYNNVITAENPDNYKNIYQYDPLGMVSNTGYGTTTWCANIFTAKSNETLKAVSFYTTDSNCNYEIHIYTNPGSNPISQAGPILNQTGTSPYAGYHTIHLDSEIYLKAGQKFSIVLKITTPGYIYPIAIEYPLASYSSKATANPGESFISPDGNTWGDITGYAGYANTNVCIKAFTDPVSVLPVANFTSNVTSGYAPLTVQFTDSSTNATYLQWNFGDNSDNASVADPEHVFNSTGNFNVVLTASNGNSSDSKSMIINVTSQPVLSVFPGCTNSPIDMNGDGLYEDINGNGRLDFADVVTYFNNMAWIPQNEPVTCFDYNRNGRIDFSDVVSLFNMKSS